MEVVDGIHDTLNIHLNGSNDMKGIDSLLATPIIFQEASSNQSKGLGIPKGYIAVNEDDKQSINANYNSNSNSNVKAQTDKSPTKPTSNSNHSSPEKAVLKPNKNDIYPWHIAPTFPKGINNVGKGLRNLGNTCFLNSTLQCLLHTPSLINFLSSQHAKGRQDNKFCMIEALKQCSKTSFISNGSSFAPSPVVRNLKQIARHMTIGRQEDAQEFLRYAVDALQSSYLSNFPKHLPPKTTETSPVHKIFGGKLRSRVMCQNSKHASDTFDTFLDLSVTVKGCSNIQESFKAFTAFDSLEGQNKYKCESCKKPVNATKQFTIHEAPQCLTVHLKRFSPMGQKLNGSLSFDENLDIQKYMSKGQSSPKYKLYGVVSHYGGSARSGHYIAHVKAPNGRWYEMNDDLVSLSRPPLGSKNAYVLFYERERNNKLDQALQLTANSVASTSTNNVNGNNENKVLGKRKAEDDLNVATTSNNFMTTPIRDQMKPKMKTPSSAPPVSNNRPKVVSFDKSNKKKRKSSFLLSSLKRDTLSDDIGSPVERN